MSRSSKQAKRISAYVNSQVALGVPAEEINKAIMSRPIAELEAEAEAKAAAASAAASGATAPSGTPSTPPTLPASPPLGTPPTLPALPPSGTPPTLPALPPSGNATLSGTPSTPPHPVTPGSSSFNNWYEEIAVSRLSNSTPCVFSKALVVINYTNPETNGNQSAEEVELLELDSDTNSLTPTVSPPPTTTSAPNAPQSNNSTLLETCSVNENHNTNYGFCLPEFSKALTVLPTGAIKQGFYKPSQTNTASSLNTPSDYNTNSLFNSFQVNTQTQTSNSTPFIHIYDLIKNTPSLKFNNITNSTNVTTSSETHSTTPFEVQTPALDQPGINNVTNTTVTDAPSSTPSEFQAPDLGARNALQSNNSTLLETCSVNENHNTNYGFCLTEFSKALTVLPTGAIKQGFYKPSQTNTASLLNTPSDYNTNSLFNSFQVNTQTQTSNSTPFIHIYDLIKNTPSLKFNNITNSTSVNMNEDEQKLPSLPLNTLDHKLFFQSYSLIPQLITTTRIDEYLVDNTTLDNNITPNESPYNINYGRSKSTCLDRINYIDDMKKDDLLYAAKCFNSQFNSSQECMIKSFDIQYNHSSPNHEFLSCDIYKGLINLGCKWVSKACESIENINSIDTELCYETIDARNDKIPEITGWHIEIKCDDQTACNAGKKQVTQIALCGSIEDNNYTDNIYSSYDE